MGSLLLRAYIRYDVRPKIRLTEAVGDVESRQKVIAARGRSEYWRTGADPDGGEAPGRNDDDHE